jgi:hypothetical protein
MAAPVFVATVNGLGVHAASVTTTSLTSAATNYILLAVIYNEATGSPAVAVSSVTSAGVTWARRKRSNGSATGSLELWWARGTGALSAYPVTVNFASGAYDDSSVIIVQITGCADPAAPFDVNASFPAAQSAPTATWTPTFTGISTSSKDDMLLFITGTISGGATAATGFAEIGRAGNGGGSWSSIAKMDAKSVTAAQSGATFTHGSALTTVFGAMSSGEAIFDALAGTLPPSATAQARAWIMA